MKNSNIIYEKGRVIRATYFIDNNSESGKIITSNLIVLKDVSMVDDDILCVNFNNIDEFISIPNIKENITILPKFIREELLDSIITRINNKNDKYNYMK